MEYIILDLEWDSVFFPPKKRFINQILQIGAVKLNTDFEVVDTFCRTVRSEISPKVSSRFSKLTGITSQIMLEGIPFSKAVKDYNEFAQSSDVTMSWSDSDLYTIIENEDFLLGGEVTFKMKAYLDLQKLVQSYLASKGYDSKNQISLESAAQLMGVDTSEFNLHTALDDSMISAKLFKIAYNEKRFNELKKDTSQKDFYARLRFKSYNISDINDSFVKQTKIDFACPKCSGETKRITNWKYKNCWFMANFKCKECGYKFSGRATFKKTFDDVKVKTRICELRTKKRKPDDMQSMPEAVQSN